MNLINILLWSVSLTLAVIGVSFGVIASIYSTKANKKIKDLISNTFVSEESQKFLFDNLKNVITANRKTIRSFNNENLTYSEYLLVSSHSRMHLLSKSTIDVLSETEFKDLVNRYIEIKKTLDKKFTEIVKIKNLSTKKVIPLKLRESLKKYHHLVISSATDIIKSYIATIDYTTEHSLNKK